MVLGCDARLPELLVSFLVEETTSRPERHRPSRKVTRALELWVLARWCLRCGAGGQNFLAHVLLRVERIFSRQKTNFQVGEWVFDPPVVFRLALVPRLFRLWSGFGNFRHERLNFTADALLGHHSGPVCCPTETHKHSIPAPPLARLSFKGFLSDY